MGRLRLRLRAARAQAFFAQINFIDLPGCAGRSEAFGASIDPLDRLLRFADRFSPSPTRGEVNPAEPSRLKQSRACGTLPLPLWERIASLHEPEANA